MGLAGPLGTGLGSGQTETEWQLLWQLLWFVGFAWFHGRDKIEPLRSFEAWQCGICRRLQALHHLVLTLVLTTASTPHLKAPEAKTKQGTNKNPPTPAAAGGARQRKGYFLSDAVFYSPGSRPDTFRSTVHSAGSIPVLLQQLWPWPWFLVASESNVNQ